MAPASASTSAGQCVVAQSDGATALAGQYLAALAMAHYTVHHPTVAAAVARYRDTWQPRVNEVAPQIDALGTSTAGSATVIAHSDQDSTALLAQQGDLGIGQGTVLTRPVIA